LGDGIDTSAQACGQGAGLATEWADGAGGIARLGRKEQSQTRDVPQGNPDEVSIAVGPSGKLKHGLHRLLAIEFWPAVIRVSEEDIDASRKAGDLAGESHDAATVTSVDFQTTEGIAPPTGKRGVGVFTTTDGGDQTSAAKEEEIAIADPILGLT